MYFLIKNQINSTTAPGAPVDPLVGEINRERRTQNRQVINQYLKGTGSHPGSLL
jgi:hypothetical protein